MAKERRGICIKGSSALNSLAGYNAFPLTVESPVSMRALKKIWDEIDSDGDGRISAPEFRTWIQTGNATLGGMSSSIFSTLDKTRQGHLTFNTFLRAMYPTASKQELRTLMRWACGGKMGRQRFAASKHTLEEIQVMFKAADVDGTKGLNLQEFLVVMGSAGYEQDEAFDMFAVVDVDGSGVIQLEEFSSWYEAEVASAARCHPNRAPTLLDALLDWSSSSSSSSSTASSPRMTTPKARAKLQSE